MYWLSVNVTSDATFRRLDEALNLPPDERAELAMKLLDSLDDNSDAELSSAWDAEIRKRVGRMLDGSSKAAAWPEARARILERLSRR